MNEETEDPGEAPGRAAIWATIILVLTYVIVTVAAISFGGPERLANDDSGDVLGLLANDVFGSTHARQDRDHRGAVVGGGLVSDDDPPDGANVAVDGAGQGAARRSSARSTRAT